MVVVGDAATTAPVVGLRLVVGNQEYVVPPLAVKLTGFPIQYVAAVGVITMVGVGFTVTVTVALAVQPLALVPVTV